MDAKGRRWMSRDGLHRRVRVELVDEFKRHGWVIGRIKKES